MLVAEFLYLYHISHHSGIDAAPLDKWQRSALVHGRDMILDERQFDIVTGVTVHGKRVTANGGVRMFGMQWKGENLPAIIDAVGCAEPHATRLEATVGITTKIKYNPEDMLHVHVFVGDDWVRLTNTQEEYAAGLTLWQHRQIQEWSKRQSLAFNTVAERLAARDELNRTIREAFPDMDARERRAMARMVGADAAEAQPVEVIYAEAEPRHDGMGAIIEHEVPATDREDAHRKPSRPGFGGDDPATDGAGPASTDGGDDGQDGDDHTPAFGKPDPVVEPSPVDDDQAGDEEYK